MRKRAVDAKPRLDVVDDDDGPSYESTTDARTSGTGETGTAEIATGDVTRTGEPSVPDIRRDAVISRAARSLEMMRSSCSSVQSAASADGVAASSVCISAVGAPSLRALEIAPGPTAAVTVVGVLGAIAAVAVALALALVDVRGEAMAIDAGSGERGERMSPYGELDPPAAADCRETDSATSEPPADDDGYVARDDVRPAAPGLVAAVRESSVGRIRAALGGSSPSATGSGAEKAEPTSSSGDVADGFGVPVDDETTEDAPDDSRRLCPPRTLTPVASAPTPLVLAEECLGYGAVPGRGFWCAADECGSDEYRSE